jgi:peptidoglycan/LPS O-acetylase OafA/YrhL
LTALLQRDQRPSAPGAPAPHSPTALGNRPDLDGLRAIAILSVVAYHAAPNRVSGGFVGVDMFFVLSSYLISSIILREMDADRFSLARFYARRIRRLFPALLVVIAATAAAGWFYLLPHEMRALGGEIAAGAAYVINFTLQRQAGYFDIAASQKPLLHLWSLAIEEQFYIVYPALLMLVRPRGNRWLFALLAAATIASAAFCIAETARNSAAAFYLPYSRIWELSGGGLLAFAELYPGNSSRRLARWLGEGVQREKLTRDALSLAGLGLAAGSAIGFSAGLIYPGAWALAPCAGALLLIAAGPGALVNRRLLSLAPMVGIGLVSYPLYLWHWPLLWLVNLIGDGDDWRARFAAVAAAALLALATYFICEAPLRRIRATLLAPYLFAGMWALCLVGGAFGMGLIGPRLTDSRLRDIGDAVDDFTYPGGLRKERLPSGRSIGLAGSGAATTMYFGDSNIEQYWPRVQTLLGGPAAGKSAIFVTAGGCPPIPGYRQDRQPRCAGFAEEARDLAFRAGVSRVVIGADWAFYVNDASFYFLDDSGARVAAGAPTVQRALESLRAMVVALRDHGVAVWIVSNIPTGAALAPLNGLKRSWSGAIALAPGGIDRAPFERDWAPFREGLEQIAAATGSQFIDPMPALCDAASCRATAPDGAPIYKDANHLRSSWVRDHADFIDRTLLDGAASDEQPGRH